MAMIAGVKITTKCNLNLNLDLHLYYCIRQGQINLNSRLPLTKKLFQAEIFLFAWAISVLYLSHHQFNYCFCVTTIDHHNDYFVQVSPLQIDIQIQNYHCEYFSSTHY